jgi:hypothetical protein
MTHCNLLCAPGAWLKHTKITKKVNLGLDRESRLQTTLGDFNLPHQGPDLRSAPSCSAHQARREKVYQVLRSTILAGEGLLPTSFIHQSRLDDHRTEEPNLDPAGSSRPAL